LPYSAEVISLEKQRDKNEFLPGGGLTMGRLVYFCAGARLRTLPAMKVKNMLINVMDSSENERVISETRTIFKRADTDTVMLDSGGHQIYEAEKQNKEITSDASLPIMRSKERINISPLHVVEAACKLRPTIMTALDFPLRDNKARTDQEQEFLRKLGFNMTWAIQTASLREKHCPDIQLFIPVQCYNLDQFEIFRNPLSSIQYDGLSLPFRSLTLSELALFLLRFYQIGVRKVHILGTSSFFLAAAGAFFAHHFFEWVSFDATTWRESAQHEIYLNPNDLSPEHIRKDVQIDEDLPMMCQCPFCENTTFTFIKNLPYTEKVDLLRNHNFCVIEKVTEELFEEAGNLSNLGKFLKNRSSQNKDIDELTECLSSIDLLRDEDINVLKSFFGISHEGAS
jgi:queuine/archaeosine tRNA-ribosyltransferase